jgi:putative transposase
MAIYNRRPSPGLIPHSDRGSQYTSVKFGSRLKAAGLLDGRELRLDSQKSADPPSLVAEPTDRKESLSAVYAEGCYSTRRRHSALGHLRPSKYEEARMRVGAVA